MPRWHNQVGASVLAANQASIAGPVAIYGASCYLDVERQTTLHGVVTLGDTAADELIVNATEETAGVRGTEMVDRARLLNIGDANYTMVITDVRDYYLALPATGTRTFKLLVSGNLEGHAVWIINGGSIDLQINNTSDNHYGTLPAGFSAHYLRDGTTWDLIALCPNTYPS